MKKNITVIFILSLMCCMLLAGCGEKPQDVAREHYSVSINQTTAVLAVYGKLELTAAVTNSEGAATEDVAVAWSSSDPSVAEVTDGIVIAKGEGQAEITAKLSDEEAAVCQVTVEKNGIIPQLQVTNAADNKLTIANGQTYHLESVVSFGGEDCTDADTIFTFRTSDTSVATVSDDGVITAVSQGTTQIVATAAWRGMGGESLTGGRDAYGLRIVIELTVTEP